MPEANHQQLTERLEAGELLEQAPEDKGSGIAEEIEAWKDRYTRLAADYDNSRKRSAREVEAQVRRERERMIQDWIGVVDSVERALTHAPEKSGPWYEGTLGIHRLMLDLLARYGVEPIGAVDEPFDPRFHEALGVIEDPSRRSGAVAHVQSAGFKATVDGRVIKPAQVLVVK